MWPKLTAVRCWRQVRLGEREEDQVQILAGVREGEEVYLNASEAAARRSDGPVRRLCE